MTTIKINEQIAFLRKQKGLTQEELATALGVTNQAVSKWEAAQCCPDIQLLPAIAKLFDVSTDELLGYSHASSTGDSILALRRKIGSLPREEAFDFTFQMAAALHILQIAKTMESENPGWNTDDAIEHARKTEWGYSCCSIPEITTVMRRSTIFFSNNKNMHLMNSEFRRTVQIMKPFADINNLKTAFALYQLTVSSEKIFATVTKISEESGLSEAVVENALMGDLLPFISEKEGEGNGYRFNGAYMSLIPILSLLDCH